MNTKEDRAVVIVGASAAGLRCASRLARLAPEVRVTVIETQEKFSYAACGLPYLLSGDVSSEAELRSTADGVVRDAEYFRRVKGVTVLRGRATGVDAATRTIAVETPEERLSLPWDELVLATGARARALRNQPTDPRIHTFHQLSDLAPLLEGLKAGALERVAVLGGGLTGCELAEAFSVMWGVEITLCEAEATPLASLLDSEAGALVIGSMQQNDVVVKTDALVERIEPLDESVDVVLANGERVSVDAVVVALGVDPATELAVSAGVDLGPHGGIAVTQQLATSVDHIWAAGDCVELPSAIGGGLRLAPLGSLANRQGRLLGDILAGRQVALPPIAGATGIKVFDTNVAAVGITRRQATREGLETGSAWVTTTDAAHYWPEAAEIFVHLVYEVGSLRVLGVQVVGEGEAHKRVDVATQLIVRGATLQDLADLEHAYAPPYAPALEPLAVAAMVALNQENEGMVAVPPTPLPSGTPILDVRHLEEREAHPMDGDVLAIPLETLRERVSELASTSEWVVVCERGARSAEALRLLQRKGLRGRYLGGGAHWLRSAEARLAAP